MNPFYTHGRQLLLATLLATGTLVAGCGGSSGESSPSRSSSSEQSSSSSNSSVSSSSSTSSSDDGGGFTGPLECDADTYATAMDLRIYQVMTEAFINGDPSISYGAGYGTSHHSGDIQGIIDSLDYVKSLGFNAIWLTPVFDSVALPDQDIWADRLDATSYYASNYFAIDPNFGSMEKARELVNKAHEKGLYVFFDGVFGHFKNNAEQYPSPSDRTVTTGGGSVANTGRLAIYPDDVEFFKEVASHWVRELKIDGWRLDQAYQVPLDAWVQIRHAVQEASAEVTYTNADGETVNPLGYMVAEIWKGESDIAAEAYGPQDDPALCSAFDFPVRYALVQALAVEESGTRNATAARLNTGFATHAQYPDHAIPNGFLGNHDLLRFGDLLQRGDIAGPADNGYWLRHKAAYSFLSAYSGPITLYYGEEIGDEVPNFADPVTTDCANQGLCDDHVARNSGKVEGLPSGTDNTIFTANDRQADLRDYLAQLMTLRAAEPALHRGERTPITVPLELTEQLYVAHKSYEGEAIVYLLNISDQPVSATFDACALGSSGDLVNLLTDEVIAPTNNQYTIEVPATTGLFLKVSEPVAEGPGCSGNDGPVGDGPLAQCDNPTVEESGPLNTQMYIRGSYSGGDNFGATPTDRAFGYKGENLYQVVVTEPGETSYTFKFASSDWSYEFAVAGSAAVQLGTEQAMSVASGPGSESSISIPEAADYVFSFQIDETLDGGTMMVSQCP